MVNLAKYGSASFFASYAVKEYMYDRLDEETKKRAGEILEEMLDDLFKDMPIREFRSSEQAINRSILTINGMMYDEKMVRMLLSRSINTFRFADFIHFFIVFNFDEETHAVAENGDEFDDYHKLLNKFNEFNTKLRQINYDTVMARIAEEQK